MPNFVSTKFIIHPSLEQICPACDVVWEQAEDFSTNDIQQLYG